jgi:mannose-6-phosphate isomerase-like protein (cupin superfamily)
MLRDTTVLKSMPTKTKKYVKSTSMILLQLQIKCEEIWYIIKGHGSQIKDRDGNEADGSLMK